MGEVIEPAFPAYVPKEQPPEEDNDSSWDLDDDDDDVAPPLQAPFAMSRLVAECLDKIPVKTALTAEDRRFILRCLLPKLRTTTVQPGDAHACRMVAIYSDETTLRRRFNELHGEAGWERVRSWAEREAHKLASDSARIPDPKLVARRAKLAALLALLLIPPSEVKNLAA